MSIEKIKARLQDPEYPEWLILAYAIGFFLAGVLISVLEKFVACGLMSKILVTFFFPGAVIFSILYSVLLFFFSVLPDVLAQFFNTVLYRCGFFFMSEWYLADLLLLTLSVPIYTAIAFVIHQRIRTRK